MAKKFRVQADIVATDKASKVVGKVQGRFKRLSTFLKKNFVAAAVAATVAIAGLVRGLKAMITAAQTQEDAVIGLNAALARLGPTAAGVSKRLQEQAAALQLTTRFGDEAIIAGQSLIATFSDDEEVIKQLTVSALDLSVAMKVDLKASFLLMAKAAAGDFGTLSRYGVIIDKDTKQSEKFAAVLALLAKKFGGRAAADVETFSGRVGQLGNAFGDLLEKLGDTIIKNDDIVKSIERATKFIAANAENIAKIMKFQLEVIGGFFGGIFNKLTQLGTLIGSLTNTFRRLTGITDDIGASQEALEARAAKLGITVEELRKILEGVGGAIGVVGTEAEETAPKLGALSTVSADLGTELTSAEKAVLALGDALGVLTTVKVEAEIRAIEEALAAVKVETGETGERFIRLNAIAQVQLTALRQKLDDVANGVVGIVDNFKTAEEAALGLGDALGVITSVEIEAEINKINEALRESAEILDVNGAQYIELNRRAQVSLTALNEKLLQTKAGIFDVGETATTEFGRFQEGLTATSALLEQFFGKTGAAIAERVSSFVGGLRTVGTTLESLANDTTKLGQISEGVQASGQTLQSTFGGITSAVGGSLKDLVVNVLGLSTSAVATTTTVSTLAVSTKALEVSGSGATKAFQKATVTITASGVAASVAAIQFLALAKAADEAAKAVNSIGGGGGFGSILGFVGSIASVFSAGGGGGSEFSSTGSSTGGSTRPDGSTQFRSI